MVSMSLGVLLNFDRSGQRVWRAGVLAFFKDTPVAVVFYSMGRWFLLVVCNFDANRTFWPGLGVVAVAAFERAGRAANEARPPCFHKAPAKNANPYTLQRYGHCDYRKYRLTRRCSTRTTGGTGRSYALKRLFFNCLIFQNTAHFMPFRIGATSVLQGFRGI
jgi:hypothetical protein